MNVVFFDRWNEEIAQRFIQLKQKLQGTLPTYFPEEPEDYDKILGAGSVFAQDYAWKIIIVFAQDKPVAKAVLAWRKDSLVGNLGFIDWIHDHAVADKLIEAVEAQAREQGLKELKTPVDLNFFVKYRIKVPGGGHPLFGEPIYPDYYHELFQKTGFSVIGTWDTYRVNRTHIIRNFTKKRQQLRERRHPFEKELTVRNINLSQWDHDLGVVYELFVQSFSKMSEFEPISLEQFKVVYDDFRYIMHPWYSYIVELHGKPVGFSINYPDPLPVLKHYKGKKLNLIGKIWLLLRLRTNFRTLLMAYVGKIPGPQGEEIKGIQIKTSKQLSSRAFFFGKGLVCYQSADSPSRRPIDPASITPFSQYVLYGKKLE